MGGITSIQAARLDKDSLVEKPGKALTSIGAAVYGHLYKRSA
jgi:hypothetical protein